ncbi:hypothetical protein CFR75_05635 [Komagataeibacter xylinus]|uniref:Pilus assembly protein n=1 Tax=Komagataeibacter xylinus TaxID=28448 RepID=A0A318Q460_KOMXY|nr:Flp family type IVb pilin [Komagataeibacter xylinus]PYD57520.1 hypothetical protein CFR75_05635 [Komagataeibacter xylinus]
MIYYKKKAQQDVGATAIEYGLIASLVAVVAVTGMSAVGGNLSNTYCTISKHLGGSGTCSGASTGNANGGGGGGGGGGSTSVTGGSSSVNNSGAGGTTESADLDSLTGSAYLNALDSSLKDEFNPIYLDQSLGGTNGFSAQPLIPSISMNLLTQMTGYNQLHPDDQIKNVFGLYDGLTQHPITSWSEASQVLNDAINNAGYVENNIHTGGNNGREFEFTTQKGRVFTIDGLLGTMTEQLQTGQ